MTLPTDVAEQLGKPLEAARVKTRAAGGNRPSLSYLESHDVIRTANSIFGFGEWGHEVQDLRLIQAVTVHNQQGTAGIHVGYVCIVRLNVAGCMPTSGIGYGDATEYRESAAVTAHELAAKEAESDALKRAFKNFGDQFGLALYDKQAASSGHIAGGQKSPDFSAKKTETAAPALTYDTGALRSDAQAKLLMVLFRKLSDAGAITEEAFCNAAAAAKQGGAQGTTAQACCETITKAGASELISKLKTLEQNVAKAAA